MTPKEQFLKDKELAKWWASIAHDERFEKALVYCQAQFMQSRPDTAQLSGVLAFIDTLLAISDNAPSDFDLSAANPGMHHDVDQMPKKVED